MSTVLVRRLRGGIETGSRRCFPGDTGRVSCRTGVSRHVCPRGIFPTRLGDYLEGRRSRGPGRRSREVRVVAVGRSGSSQSGGPQWDPTRRPPLRPYVPCPVHVLQKVDGKVAVHSGPGTQGSGLSPPEVRVRDGVWDPYRPKIRPGPVRKTSEVRVGEWALGPVNSMSGTDSGLVLCLLSKSVVHPSLRLLGSRPGRSGFPGPDVGSGSETGRGV